MRTRTVLLAVLVCLGVAAAPAGAATSLHVAPAPANPNGACDANDPCSLARALLIGTTGDDVTVAPGGYVLQANGIGTGIFLHGEAGRPAPEIVLPSALLAVQGGGGIRHLHITGQSPSTPLSFSGTGTVEDVVIRSSGAAADGLDVVGIGGPAVVRDVAVSGPGLLNGILAEGNVTMRNVTAVTGRANGDAIKVFAPNGLNTVVDARNVVAVATAGQDLANVNIFAGETSSCATAGPTSVPLASSTTAGPCRTSGTTRPAIPGWPIRRAGTSTSSRTPRRSTRARTTRSARTTRTGSRGSSAPRRTWAPTRRRCPGRPRPPAPPPG